MEKKKNQLIERIKEIGESYLMFSGGLDSCAILGSARLAGVKVTPVWVNNGFGRASEYLVSKQADLLGGGELKVINLEPSKAVRKNPEDRCYYCKSQIISAIKQLGDDVKVMDGTTGSDTGYRPGRMALSEQGVISPLAELEISSPEAKAMAISMGADKDIAGLESCMATRINYGVPLDIESQRAVKEIEQAIIAETQDYNVRCRIDDADHIRIELSSEDSFKAMTNVEFRNRLISLGEKVAMFVTIDLKPSRPNAYDARVGLTK